MGAIHEKLAHLTRDQIGQLMVDYYVGNVPVNKLIELYQIDIYPSNLYTLFPPRVHEDKRCAYCDVAMISKMPSKSEYDNYVPGPFCPKCRHEGGENCQCNTCTQVRHHRETEVQHQKAQIIQDLFKPTGRKVEPWLFDLEHLVSFLAYVRIGVSEDYGFIEALDLLSQPLSPDRQFDIKAVGDLFENRIIKIHEQNDPSIFTFENGEPVSFSTTKAKWRIGSFLTMEERREFVKSVEDYIRDARENCKREELVALWEKIALRECLTYLRLQMEDHNLPFNPGEKTEMILKDVLRDYSIGQAFYFIWGAVTNAAAYYQRDGVTIHHAANTVPGTIQRRVEKARADNWRVEPYRRDRRSPQSAISQVFYTTLMKDTGQGLERPIFPVASEIQSKKPEKAEPAKKRKKGK